MLAQTSMIIGDEFDLDIKVTNTYKQFKSSHQGSTLVYQQEFHSKDASYIKLYFEDFDLAPGDYVKITGNTSNETLVYASKGKVIDSNRNMISNFWSQILMEDTVTLELYSFGEALDFDGFKITKVAYGYTEDKIMEQIRASEQQKSICSANNKESIACYENTEMFEKAKAVCRLVIGGRSLCTGWLLGSEGHIMTNNHCIGSASAARNTDFIFNYQYQNCSGGSDARRETVASSSTMIKTNSGLDYTLVKLPVNPTSKYGYLSLSSEVASSGDRIYIPQHPGGRRKEIAVRSDRDATAQGFAKVYTSSNYGRGRQLTYYADTEGGSSGSPVIDYNSNLVVSIHNTGGCPNGSSGRSDSLIRAIGNDMPSNGVDNDGGDTPPPPPPTPDCDTIDFNSVRIFSFSNQDANGSYEIDNSGAALSLQNNTWKVIPFDYTVTRNTVLEFEFSSKSQGEIHAVGFESNNQLTSGYYFRVYGVQNYGVGNFDNYSGSGTTTYKIPVGNFYTGSFDRMVFINDNDQGSGNSSIFRNVKVYENACGNGSRSVDLISSLETTATILGDSIEDGLLEDFVITPNPATTTFSIELNDNSTDGFITLYSLQGKVLMTSPLTSEKETFSIQENNLAKGIYLIKMTKNNQSTTKKLIIN